MPTLCKIDFSTFSFKLIFITGPISNSLISSDGFYIYPLLECFAKDVTVSEDNVIYFYSKYIYFTLLQISA